MKKIENIHELRKIQIAILDNVHHFCEANGLTYYLYSGTLLGAVRHKGYIPWDDDIDISMPRKDYERFLQLYYDVEGIYRVINPATEPHFYYTFAKVIDSRTRMIEDGIKGYEISVYIDIFPIDYVPDDMSKRERLFRLKKMLYKIRRCKISDFNPLYSQLAYWCYKLLPIPVTLINKCIRNLIISKVPTSTVCNLTEAGPNINGCYPAEDIASTIDIEFEGKMFKTLVGYHDMLQRSYGDYMELPPEDQRLTHHFTAYWI